MKNIFYGTYNEVGDYRFTNEDGEMITLGDQIIGLKCSADNSSVEKYSECNAGLFIRFQDSVQNIVALTLVLALFFIGFMVAFGMLNDMKQILKYIVIISIVLYFVKGNAWQDGFFDFFIDGGSEIAALVFNSIDSSGFSNLDNGYSGPAIQLPDNITCIANEETGAGPNNIIYPEFAENNFSEKYLIWDMFDCRAINFFTGGINKGADSFVNSAMNWSDVVNFSLFALLVFVLFFAVIVILIPLMFLFLLFKSIFIIVSTMIVITLLVFISPLIIPLVLFNNQKARGIFDNWLKNLIGYAMVPIILFMVLAMFFKILDSSMYGDDIAIKNTSGQITGEADVFIYDVAKDKLEIYEECNRLYLPCIIHLMGQDKYNSSLTILGMDIPFLGKDVLFDFLQALLRFFFVLLVMLLVYAFLTSALITGLLGVSVMPDNVFSGMQGALKGAGKMAGGALIRLKNGAGKLRKAASGRNDNDYGTK
jgi:type IV secretory pathway VirB6-like protein